MKILSFFRSTFLAIAMAFIGYVIATDGATNNISTILFFGSCLFLLLELISLIIQIVRNKKAIQYSFLAVLYNRPSATTIDFFRRLSLYGIIAMVVFIALGNTDLTPAVSDKANTTFLFFVKWSAVSFVFSFILTIIRWVFYMPHAGEGAYGPFTILGKIIASDFMAVILPLAGDIRLMLRSENKLLAVIKMVFHLIILAFVVLGTLHFIGII